MMSSYDRPSPDEDRKTISDSDLNEALENDKLEKGQVKFDDVEHDEGERAPGPEPDPGRRPPQEQDVTAGEEGRPVEPPD
jgi:hypothetical protein